MKLSRVTKIKTLILQGGASKIFKIQKNNTYQNWKGREKGKGKQQKDCKKGFSLIYSV